MCGVVLTDAGEEEVVVAGGHRNNVVVDEVEIYNVASRAWRTGIQ